MPPADRIASLQRISSATQELRWIYVDFNSYFASVEQQLQPHLRGKPVAVVPVDSDSTSAIAASYEAKRLGIGTGTRIYEAKKLCPELVCVLANHEKYVEYHHRILDEVERHMPVTAVCSIDEVASRLMNNENSPERATEIARAVKAGLATHVGEYIRCSIGIAPNRYLAKVATDLHKPDGLTVLQGADVPARLLDLKLRDLCGIGPNMELRLRQAGIHSVAALWQLDAARMRQIWGNIWGEKMWYLLRGYDLSDPETSRSTIGHSHVLAPSLRQPDAARLVARRLMLKATSRLRRMEYYAASLSLSVRLEDGSRFATSDKCYRAQDSVTFLHLLERLWDQLQRRHPRARIKKVSVSLHHLVAANALITDLFESSLGDDVRHRSKWERMSRALDTINHRYGRDTVSLGMLPSEGRSFSGTKVAFTRIPDMDEFFE